MRCFGNLRWLSIATQVVLAMAFASMGMLLSPVFLSPAATGGVQVTAAIGGRISISISDPTVRFGLDGMVDVFEGEESGLGSCYLWKGDGGGGNTIVVKSNRPWNGELVIGNHTEVEATLRDDLRMGLGTQPAESYTECQRTGSASLSEDGYRWEMSGRKGVSTYSHYYSLSTSSRHLQETLDLNVVYVVSQY
jgi:hypothetical protein